ncbi:MAG: gliding motility-associated ABC transporter substrate-binding protein GldG [Cytophagales bacterium]|nr:gliding motility-associated ABC transporter substrate-binding protein GldG [Cytophagales bacterium]
MSWDSNKLHQFLRFTIGALTLLLLIQVFNAFRFRIDMTEEKRYSISEASQQLLNNLEEPLTIESYLAGELPSNFKRFQKSIDDLLDQFTIYAGNNLQYRFVDPSQATSTQSRNEYMRSLIDKGLQPTNLTYTKDGQKSEKLVFPGVLITYGNKELAVPLLKGNRTSNPDEMLNQSIEGLEYELIAAIKSITETNRKRIAYIVGHGEPDSVFLAGFTNAILGKYDLFKVDLASRTTPLVGYDVAIIGKPTERFTEKEKYLIDQYVMNGGSLLVFVDALKVNVLEAEGEGTIALPYDLNLEDLLFRYGIRINQDYVTDFSSGFYPVVSGNVGNQPRVELLPWPFFPIVSNYADHPLVKGLDATQLKFVSTMDTVKAKGVKKIPLIFTSQYTRVISPPVQVRFNDFNQELRPEFFQSGPRAVGYLLEGKFSSLYKNRILPKGIDQKTFEEESIGSKVIVVSDGDFIRNELSINTEQPEPLLLGVDPYARTTYANEEFLLRSLSYLTDEDGITLARNKEVKIRPLDRVKIKNDRSFWVFINFGMPLLLLALFGLIKFLARKRKFAK